jgi:adenosylhomocysteine nucleosidase
VLGVFGQLGIRGEPALHALRMLRAIVRGWTLDRRLRPQGIWLWESPSAVAACAGVGAARVALAVEADLGRGPASRLCSIGYAGACSPRISPGRLLRPSLVIDTRTGERYECGGDGSRLACAAAIAGTAEKARLEASYGADAVDMESATVARMAEQRRLPFAAIKAVSDGAGLDLGMLRRFLTLRGQFRTWAFGLYAVTHPGSWAAVRELARGSKLAAEAMAGAVREEISRAERHR